MEYRRLGRSGLKVSAYCLGTMTFGRQIEEARARRIIDVAIERGVTFVDTADMYVNGETERIVGRALQGKRHAVVLASKVGHLFRLGSRYGEQRHSGPWDLARPRPFIPWDHGR